MTEPAGPPNGSGSGGSGLPHVTGLLGQIYAGTLDCVHCGLCLSSCPTYLATGRESSSPRGRIYLMRGVAEGKVELAGLLAEEAHLCLGCRACETACPSGVEFGAMLEDTRAVIQQAGARRGLSARIERWALRGIVAHPSRLRALVSLLGFAQRHRLDRAVLAALPGSFGAAARNAHALMPPLPLPAARQPLPEFVLAEGSRRGRVAFFTGCLMSEIFGAVQQASVRVLAANGFDVIVPRGQGCCGALHAHAGDLGFASDLARSNVKVFDELFELRDVDAIIVDSAGCGAAMREADRWLPGEGAAFAGRVRDVCEFLDEVGLREMRRSVVARVCYDDPCHLVHGQGVRAAPRRLLSLIDGLELLDHPNPTRCCGAAGTYNLTQPEMSKAVLDEKLDSLASVEPDVIATGNPGCMMQLAGGVRERGLAARVVHPVELLDEAFRR